METEGPQTNEGNGLAPPDATVVQLGDWIGPRDELVPFGRRPRPRLPERPLAQAARPRSVPEPASNSAPSNPPATATSEPPPSAEDFWGERAAAIHDALQAPADEWPPAAAAGDDPSRAESDARACVSNGGVSGRSLAAAACVAILALAGLATALNPLGGGASRHGAGGGPRLPLASVLNNGVSRALTLELSRIKLSTARPRIRVVGSARARRQRTRSRPISEPVHYTTHAAISHPGVPAYTVRVTPAASAPTDAAETQTSRPSPLEARPTSSRSTAPATGASGALGPIQSPNG